MAIGRSIEALTQHPFQGRVWRDMAQLAAEALAAGLLVSLVLALAIFIATTQAQAAPVARAYLGGEPAMAIGTARVAETPIPAANPAPAPGRGVRPAAER